MVDAPRQFHRLPWTATLPAQPRWHKLVQVARVAGWTIFGVALVLTCLQFQRKLHDVMSKAQAADNEYVAAMKTVIAAPTTINLEKAEAAAQAAHKAQRQRGAILRWSFEIRQLWQGRNIYEADPEAGQADPLTGERLAGFPEPTTRPLAGMKPAELHDHPARMFPNMPFVAILLTPLDWLSLPAMGVFVNLLKIAAILAALVWSASAVNDRDHRMGDWVLGLALLFALPNILGEIQHANTNTFVLAAIAAHLWLYRRGRDSAAGAALAFAICLKMTPVLFAVYWLYQRNWKLLSGMLVALALFVVIIPLVALGAGRYESLTATWIGNMIVPGLLHNAPYPTHENQSLWGFFSRVFMHCNIYLRPDDSPFADEFGYINIASLGTVQARYVMTAAKLVFLGVMAWAIGWRQLSRRDGRRGLHYALVLLAMLILNQRTWDHHAAVLLPAYLAIWYALAYGRISEGLRRGCAAAVMLSGAALWLTRQDVFVFCVGKVRGKDLSNLVEAWGPGLAHFVILFVVAVVLALAIKKWDEPYATDSVAARAAPAMTA
jgi:hypothetical protein